MVGLLAASLVAASCGTSAASDRSSDNPTIGVTSSEPAPNPTGAAKPDTKSPQRIIPLDGDLAEIVFALGLGDEVVATDLSATYPPEADAKPEIGYQRSLTAEPILAFEPTILLATPTAGPTEVLDQLGEIVTLVMVDVPITLDGPANKIRSVANALGVSERGEQLAQQTQAEIDAAPTNAAPPRVAALYLRGERVQHLFGPGSGIHAVLEGAGVVDLGEVLGVKNNAEITTESFIREQPEVVIVTTTGLESVGGIDALLAMPALVRTPVATTRQVLVFEDQYLYGFGPRTGQLLTDIVDAIYPQ